jgi:hypothetical protein
MSRAGTTRGVPTLAGPRRRGVPPEAIREFVRRVGVARANSLVDVAMFDNAVREVLNRLAPRRMAVLRPLKLVIKNYPEGQNEELEAVNNPEDASAGTRPIPFGRELYIERGDFLEDPPKGFYRPAPGREVRLRYAYFVTCREGVKDAAARSSNCAAPDSATGAPARPAPGRCVGRSGVAAATAMPAEIRLYSRCSPAPTRAPTAFIDDLARIRSGARRRGGRAGARRRQRTGACPVRAPRLFLLRSRLGAGPARFQSHDRATRRLGEAARESYRWMIRRVPPRPSSARRDHRSYPTRMMGCRPNGRRAGRSAISSRDCRCR